MEISIEEALAYEIKKELADRYFGFRKLIEDDELELSDKIRQQAVILEDGICLELARIHTQLNDDGLIAEFMALAGWQERPCCDPTPKGSPALSASLFKGLRKRGLTRAGRFQNLLLASYERLAGHVHKYQQGLAELEKSQAAIEEEISLFYRKNDIANIMEFLRSLDGQDAAATMPGTGEAGLRERYAEKMRIKPPVPVAQQLPTIPALPPLAKIRKPLKRLVAMAFRLHGPSFLASLAK